MLPVGSSTMNFDASELPAVALISLILALSGCADTNPESAAPQAASLAPQIEEDVLRGKVLRKEARKSYEAWNAGGSEYFVLDVGNAPVKERSAAEGVILRPSQNISFDVFANYVDKRVQVSGTFVAGKPYVPMDEGEAYPLGKDGKPPIRGSGFVVSGIEALP